MRSDTEKLDYGHKLLYPPLTSRRSTKPVSCLDIRARDNSSLKLKKTSFYPSQPGEYLDCMFIEIKKLGA